MTEQEIKKLNIYERLSLITAEIGVVEKSLKVQVNQNSSYKAVSERDVLDAVKPIEQKYRVYSYPASRQIVDRDILTKESEYQGKVTRSNTLFMRVETVYRFVNIDNPTEIIETTVYGDGLDTGDKATGKAMTYADKYALMKAYKLSTGDDPDKEASPENVFDKKPKATELKATEKQIAMIEDLYNDEEIEEIKKWANVTELKDLTMKKASALIEKRKGN
jgi:hypothetical protein